MALFTVNRFVNDDERVDNGNKDNSCLLEKAFKQAQKLSKNKEAFQQQKQLEGNRHDFDRQVEPVRTGKKRKKQHGNSTSNQRKKMASEADDYKLTANDTLVKSERGKRKLKQKSDSVKRKPHKEVETTNSILSDSVPSADQSLDLSDAADANSVETEAESEFCKAKERQKHKAVNPKNSESCTKDTSSEQLKLIQAKRNQRRKTVESTPPEGVIKKFKSHVSDSSDTLLPIPPTSESVSGKRDKANDVDAADELNEHPLAVTDSFTASEETVPDESGFTIIKRGKIRPADEARRVLPNWLSNPTIIPVELKDMDSLENLKLLDENIIRKLQTHGISHLFPVQQYVIPEILYSTRHGFPFGPGGYRPRDLCISAPTGSGKTLSYVIPIVKSLQNRIACQIRALVVLPVKDLAKQVHDVFKTYCEGTKLKVALCVSGQLPFIREQDILVRYTAAGYQSLADVVVATPGRLVDHIQKTPGFSLNYLRFLILDEADRLMDDIKHDWLDQVNKAVGGSLEDKEHLIPANMLVPKQYVQKLLFSATLSQNPEKLQQLGLFQPKLFASVMNRSSAELPPNESNEILRNSDLLGKYVTPKELNEQFIECETSVKPLLLLHLLHNRGMRQVLCFVNTQKAAHRLYLLIRQFGGITAHEAFSSVHVKKRNRILKYLASGKTDIIICSDVFTRGMDIDDVKYVISYDAPPYIKTYVHRIGRTARAGKEGTAITFLPKKEIHHFKRMMMGERKCTVKEMKVKSADMKNLETAYKNALAKLAELL